MEAESEPVGAEIDRIEREYQRREQEVCPDLYQIWQPEVLLTVNARRRVAARMLYEAGVFPKAGDACLEVGFGFLGWLGDLIVWGMRETDLHGMELNPQRTKRAKEILPLADLRQGDATSLPWESNSFRLVIASTLFTSILDDGVRRLIADEITRVLAPGGALLWYDFAVNNPKNSQVRRVARSEIRQLFPRLRGRIQSTTLAPPLARLLARRSWALAVLLEMIPLLRTHLLAVLVKS